MAGVAFGTGFALGVVAGSVGSVVALAALVLVTAWLAPKVMRGLI